MSDHIFPYLANCSLLFTEELRRPAAARAAGCSAEFRDNVDVVAGIGERLDMRGGNALYGNRVDGGDVAHVQIADAPGRGEPGSGRLDLDRYLADLAGRGYRGWVSLEYKPTGMTEASLAWLPRERRAVPASQGGAAPAGLRPSAADPPRARGTSERATREGGAS